jgi:uncharacterized membrane protein
MDPNQPLNPQPVNPYQAPSVTAVRAPEVEGSDVLIPGGRSVGAGQGWGWVAEGWALFVQSPLIWIVNFVIFAVIVMAISLVPFIGSIVLYVFWPVLIAGFMIGADQQHRGNALEVEHLFAGFKKNFQSLLILGLIYTAIAIAIFVVFALVIMLALGVGGLFGAMMGGNSEALAAQMAAIGAGGVMVFLIILLVMLAVSIPLMMAFWFAPALVVLHDVAPVASLGMSFKGCLKNIIPFLIYGIVFFALIIVGAIPLLLGWLVVFPLIYASTYAAYRDIYLNSAD